MKATLILVLILGIIIWLGGYAISKGQKIEKRTTQRLKDKLKKLPPYDKRNKI